MKASELVALLQAAIAEHGDLMVICWDDKEQQAKVGGVSLDSFEQLRHPLTAREYEYIPALSIDPE